MSLEALLAVLAPPMQPIEAGGAEEWPRVEETLGTDLPSDYKAYINSFGTGAIGHFLWPFNPFSDSPHVNLTFQVEKQSAAYHKIREFAPVPYPLFPEPDGLLPWGSTDNADLLFWLMLGHPDEWTVVVNPCRTNDYTLYSYDMTSFVSLILSGQISSPVFPDVFLKRGEFFVQ